MIQINFLALFFSCHLSIASSYFMAAVETSALKPSPREIPVVPSGDSNTAAYRWRAVVNRDRNAKSFVYAVQSTRIYCRPWCPARLARRANVEFYDSPLEAQSAGYRSCLRCKPDSDEAEGPQQSAIERARQNIAILALQGREAKLQELATDAKLTPSHFHKVFKKLTGVTPKQYAASVRSKRRAEDQASTAGLSSGTGSVSLGTPLSNHHPESENSFPSDISMPATIDAAIVDSGALPPGFASQGDALWKPNISSRWTEDLALNDSITDDLQLEFAQADDLAFDQFFNFPDHISDFLPDPSVEWPSITDTPGTQSRQGD